MKTGHLLAALVALALASPAAGFGRLGDAEKLFKFGKKAADATAPIGVDGDADFAAGGDVAVELRRLHAERTAQHPPGGSPAGGNVDLHAAFGGGDEMESVARQREGFREAEAMVRGG